MAKIIKIQQQLKKGFQALKHNDFSQALSIATQILSYGNQFDALVLAGISAFHLRQYTQAEGYLEQAYREKTDDQTLQIYLLESYLKNSEYDKGVDLLDKIVTKSEKIIAINLQFYLQKGEYLALVNLAEKQKASLQNYEMLAQGYEHLHNLKKAKIAANNCLQIKPTNFYGRMVLARLALRKNQPKKAQKHLKIIQNTALNPINLSIYYSLIAQCKEKQQKFKAAFRHYKLSNEALKKSLKPQQISQQNYYSRTKLAQQLDYFRKVPQFHKFSNCQQNITFMLGFPRSGTTLLENMLMAHSEIQSIEEQPLVAGMLQEFLSPNKSLQSLEQLTNNEIARLQNLYLDARDAYLQANNKPKSSIIIDKLPLNYIHIGILYRIFPNARFIISTRDLRDVALSCYFQNFSLNAAMVNFLDWQNTVDYLQEIKQLGEHILNHYKLKYVVVEYEKLVEKPFNEIKKILKLLDLDWQESIKNYRQDIKGRAIKTPSYSRVGQKIDQSQKQKWKNYKFVFKK